MNQEIHFDIFKARELRDEGIDLVVDNSREEWNNHYCYHVESWFESLPVGAEFFGEDMRAAAIRAGLDHPHHPNVWGAMSRKLTSGWCKKDRATVVGYGQSKSVANHAHVYKIYKKLT